MQAFVAWLTAMTFWHWLWLLVIFVTPAAMTIIICRMAWNDLKNFLNWPQYLRERDARKKQPAPFRLKTDEEEHPSMHEPDYDKRVGPV